MIECILFLETQGQTAVNRTPQDGEGEDGSGESSNRSLAHLSGFLDAYCVSAAASCAMLGAPHFLLMHAPINNPDSHLNANRKSRDAAETERSLSDGRVHLWVIGIMGKGSRTIKTVKRFRLL